MKTVNLNMEELVAVNGGNDPIAEVLKKLIYNPNEK